MRIIIFCLSIFSWFNSFGQTNLDSAGTTESEKIYVPTYWAYVGNEDCYYEKQIPKSTLLAQQGIFCGCFDCRGNGGICAVLEFTVILISNNEIIFTRSYNTNKFNSELTDQMKKLKKGDLVIFKDITMQFPIVSRKGASFVYEIK